MASILYGQDKKEAPALQVFLFWIPGTFNMLGGSEFRLRQGFAWGKTLVWRKSAAPPCGPRSCPASKLYGQDQKRHAFQRVFFGSGAQRQPACHVKIYHIPSSI